MKCLVIIPAYNEEENIVRVVENLKNNYPMYDYVVINDGSSDDTARLCRRKGYELVDLPVNLGLAGAFQTGLKYAWRKAMTMPFSSTRMDSTGRSISPRCWKRYRKDTILSSAPLCDGEKAPFPADDRQQADCRGHTAYHGQEGEDPTSGMRMFNKKMIAEFALNLNYGPEPDTISYLLKQGATIAEVQVEMDERIAERVI